MVIALVRTFLIPSPGLNVYAPAPCPGVMALVLVPLAGRASVHGG